jgi:molybdate transport system substrate-binding protein
MATPCGFAAVVERSSAPDDAAMRVVLLTALLVLSVAVAAPAETIRLGVAVSLKEAVTDIARAYESETGDKVEFTFGSSGQVMAQIKAGAPIDAFISAADKQVDELITQGLVDRESRRVVAGNTLVLIVPADSKVAIDSFEALGNVQLKRLAIGEPKSVPAGQYAMQALEKLMLAKPLADKLVYGSNVRQVLDYVMRGEVTAGIVYATDAKQAGGKVQVVATAPKDSHDSIMYPAVVIKKSANAAAAKRFLDHLASDDARRVLEARGFTVPPKPDAAAGEAGGRP